MQLTDEEYAQVAAAVSNTAAEADTDFPHLFEATMRMSGDTGYVNWLSRVRAYLADAPTDEIAHTTLSALYGHEALTAVLVLAQS
jgi:hypothetical protein